jgi:O-antigen ligase
MNTRIDNTLLSYKNRNSKDRKISIAITSIFLVLIIQLFLLNFLKIMETEAGSMIQLLSKIIIAFLFAYSLPAVITKNIFFTIITYLIASAIILFNFLLFPQNTEILKNQLFDFIGISLACFIYSYSIDDTGELMNVFGKIAFAIFYIGLLTGFLTITNVIYLGTYSMSYSYYMLIPAIYFLNKLLKKFDIKSLIAFLVTLFFILILGSRGPVLCMVVYFILFLIVNINYRKSKKLLFFFIASSSIALLWLIRNYLIKIMVQLNTLIGIDSRTLRVLLKNTFYTGRENVYPVVINLISKNPLLGVGIAGDRFYLGKYSHNIFLEIFSGFGIIAGSIILIVLIFIIFKSIFMKNKKKANINLIWFSLGFMPLLFSGSYLTQFLFWIYLGIAIKSIVKYNETELYKNP